MKHRASASREPPDQQINGKGGKGKKRKDRGIAFE